MALPATAALAEPPGASTEEICRDAPTPYPEGWPFAARTPTGQQPPRAQDAAPPEEKKVPVQVSPRRFLPAAGELLALEVIPWAFDRYVFHESYSYISWDTIRENFRQGPGYDSDDFQQNQFNHPYHGSLFFAAARSNGFSYWESGAFAMVGSLLWECCMENTRPSINDFVNTTLGGMTRGEIAHRVATMLRDNTSTGGPRVWREIGAALFDPVGALSRLLSGDSGRKYENPEDRFPSRFTLLGELGYRRVTAVGGGVEHPDQGIASLSAYYGDPFAGDIKNPFDSFWVGIDLAQPGTVITRLEERGVLKGWELTDPSSSIRHLFGFSQEYEYFNNQAEVFGAQMFSAGLLSRYTISRRLTAITDLSGLVVPLAGVQTTNFTSPTTGRTYDYGVGPGLRAAVQFLWNGRPVLDAGYGLVWVHTVNGSSNDSTLQYYRGSLRLPVAGPVGVGAGYSWYTRKTTYTGFFESRRTQSEWRVFLDLAFSERWGQVTANPTP